MAARLSSLSVRYGAVCGSTGAHDMSVPDNPTQADIEALLDELYYFVVLDGRAYFWADQMFDSFANVDNKSTKVKAILEMAN